MAQDTPITKSLHRLCVENPRFLVHPLFWTSKHLQVLHCHFKHLDSSSAPPPFSLPPAPPPASYGGPDITEDLIHSILNGPYPDTKFAAFTLLMYPLGVVLMQRETPFFYNKLELHIPQCEVYRTENICEFEQEPIIGYFQYDQLAKQRERALLPRSHPVPGAANLPGERLSQRRLRNLTPARWFEDAYLACVLLSLAQLQCESRKRMTEAFFVRLFVTKDSDTTHAHVFQADIPSKLLQALDNPTEDMNNLVWPAIQHILVPFEPHASFSQRVTGQLLAGLKTRAPEETPRGEKREHNVMEIVEKMNSGKAFHDAELTSVFSPSCLDKSPTANTPAGATYEPRRRPPDTQPGITNAPERRNISLQSSNMSNVSIHITT